jgi:transcriptional regulator with XRE-family HTH domain
MTLGLRIRTLRKNKKMTQTQLAKAAGVSQATISDYERDQVPNPRSNELLRIAAALETNPEFLVTGEGPANLKDAASDENSLLSAFSKLDTNAKAAVIAAAKAMANN